MRVSEVFPAGLRPPVNFAGLRSSIDLKRFVEADLGPPMKGGRWACPIHGGEGPNFAVDGDRWKCWSCGEFGDVIDYLVKRDRIEADEALDRLDPSGAFHHVENPAATAKGARPQQERPKPPAPRPDRPEGKQGPEWQAAVEALVRRGVANLWGREGSQALGWLHARGLSSATISRFRLGWLPEPITSGDVQAVRGVTIPWVAPGAWYDPTDGPVEPRWVGLNVRRLPHGDLNGPLPEGRDHKYQAVRGSERGHAYPWPEATAPGAPAFVCEGEFDALLAWQEFGWLGNVASFGGAGQNRLPDDAERFLACCPDWLLAFDADDAGDLASAAWSAKQPGRCRRLCLPPGVNDLTDLHASGGPILRWVRSEFARFGWD